MSVIKQTKLIVLSLFIDMATYVMSDLHGCKKEFDKMLKRINLQDNDTLYILGDICDRGLNNVGLLLELAQMPNLKLIYGNHDVWLNRYLDAIIDYKHKVAMLPDTRDLQIWLGYNGGQKTLDELLKCDDRDLAIIKVFLSKQEYYHSLTLNQQKYLFVHAGIGDYQETQDDSSVLLPKLSVDELVWTNPGLDDNPFDDDILVVGHRPTILYGKQFEGRMILREKMYHIDCGCVYGMNLGCLRLDDLKEFYVKSTFESE